MKYSAKRITRNALLIYILVNVFTYAFAHIAYLFANDVIGVTLEYISYYLSKSIEFLAAPILAALIYLLYKNYGRRTALLSALVISSARAFYSLPYYYILFIYNYGYDSIESILLSLSATVLVIIVTVLGIALSIGIYLFVMKMICKHSGDDIVSELTKPDEKTNIFDFLARANLPILTFSLSRFAFSLVRELIDTITFFVEYLSDYRPMEIITILLNFVLLFILLVLSYLISSAIKNKLVADNDIEKVTEE